MSDKPFLTSRELGERWQVDVSWIAMLCRRGRLPGAFKLNDTRTGAWLIPIEAVLAYEEEKEKGKERDGE